jgi:hypothetical protein
MATNSNNEDVPKRPIYRTATWKNKEEVQVVNAISGPKETDEEQKEDAALKFEKLGVVQIA